MGFGNVENEHIQLNAISFHDDWKFTYYDHATLMTYSLPVTEYVNEC